MSSDENAEKVYRAPTPTVPDERVVPPIETQGGVKKAEALQRVWTPIMKVALYITIALAR